MFSTQLNLVGRASPGGPVDDLTLTAGRWARQPGEMVWSDSGNGPPVSVGSHVTVHGVPGSPRLTVVGVATSATASAQAWVTPAEIAALRAPGAPAVSQMLYRFARAGSATQVSADVARVRAALPPGSLLGAQSWLTAKLRATRSIAPWVPVHRRVRPDRDRDGGADRGQRGQRRRGRRAPAGSACSSPSASRPPRWWRPTCSRSRSRRRQAPWPGYWPATCCPCRCSARPRGSTGWARWRCRPGSTWPCRWPCWA